MKKLFLTLLAAMAIVWQADACTNLIVGKKASADGSVICTYNCDGFVFAGSLFHTPAGRHTPGEKIAIHGWGPTHNDQFVEQVEYTYNVVGFMNERQVTIVESTFDGRLELQNPDGLLDYFSLMRLALQRSATAREAIRCMAELVEEYGYNSTGESITICDPNEAWIMEMMGAWVPDSLKATLKPAQLKQLGRTVWVARRVPDDMICGHANQSRITRFMPLKKEKKGQETVLWSKNVVSYARLMGWYTGKDQDFSYNAAYAKPDFSGRRICDARVWQFFNRYADGMDRYIPWAEGRDADAEVMPLWVKPNCLLTVQDVQAAMRDHFEGTPFDVSDQSKDKNDLGGGIWQMPYRVTPLYFEIDGKKCFNERPTSTQQTAWTFVSQMRSWLPREIGGCFWFGNDDPNMVAYTPVYCCTTRQPDCYSGKGADDVTFSMDNAFWVENWVSNMVYPRYSALFPDLKQVRDSLESSYFFGQKGIEQIALSKEGADRVNFLTKYTCMQADKMIQRWRQLATFLIVRHNDMAVRPVDEKGNFKRGKYGLGATVQRPGMPESFRRELVNRTGNKLVKPEE